MNVPIWCDESLAHRTTPICTVEDWEVVIGEVRCTLDRLCTADETVEHLDLCVGQSKCTKAVEPRVRLGGFDINMFLFKT